MPPENTSLPATPAKVGSKVTPYSETHALFGKVLTVIEETEDKIKVELKDAIHTVEAWFHRTEVAKVYPTAATAPVATPVPSAAPEPTPAPVATTPAPTPIAADTIPAASTDAAAAVASSPAAS